MAFIEVQKDGVRYRVLLGKHDINTNLEQVPDCSTGLSFEGIMNVDTYNGLAKIGSRVQYPPQLANLYQELILNRSIPMIWGEPPIRALPTHRIGVAEQEEQVVAKTIEPTKQAKTEGPSYTLEEFARGNIQVEIDDYYYTILKRAAAFQLSPEAYEFQKARNLLLGHRTARFGRYQKDNKRKREPSLLIPTGLLHAELAEILLMNDNDRVSQILDNEFIREFYDPELLSTIRGERYFRLGPIGFMTFFTIKDVV